MTNGDLANHTIGWVGAGRMGYSMASRLLKSGCDVTVYNRTRAKAEPLAELGATIGVTISAVSGLSARDTVDA